jgi:transmembrane sensor
VLNGRGLSIAARPENTINRQLAWREGMMAFSDEPLVSVIAEVSRYTDVDIEIADPKLKDLRVGAYLKVGEVDPLLDAVHASFDVRVHRIDAHHIRLTAS